VVTGKPAVSSAQPRSFHRLALNSCALSISRNVCVCVYIRRQ